MAIHDDAFKKRKEKRRATWRFQAGSSADWIVSSSDTSDRVKNIESLELLRGMVYPEIKGGARMDRTIGVMHSNK